MSPIPILPILNCSIYSDGVNTLSTKHAINQKQKHQPNRPSNPIQNQLLLNFPPTHILHYPPRPIRHPRNLPHPIVSAPDGFSVPPQLFGDFHGHRFGLGHDGPCVGERFGLGVEGVGVGEEAFFGSRSARVRRGGGVVGKAEGLSFDEGFGGLVVVAEVG